MVDAHDSKSIASDRVIVVNNTDCQISGDEILQLLREAGIDDANIEFFTPEEIFSYSELENVRVLIPIDAESCDSTELESAAMHCSNVGGRVIGVLGPGFSHDGLHPIAQKYGTQCSWSSKDLVSCISKPHVDVVPRDDAGTEIERPLPKQVKCG